MVEAPDDLDLIAYRDPFVRREGDGWRMFVGAALRDGTAAALSYTSDDLRQWAYSGIAEWLQLTPARAHAVPTFAKEPPGTRRNESSNYARVARAFPRKFDPEGTRMINVKQYRRVSNPSVSALFCRI